MELRVTVRKHTTIIGDEPVAIPVGGGRHADDRLVQMYGASGTVELRVAEAEDPTVTGDEPVAIPVGCGRHADDRLVQMHGTR
jgi:hypothetical protein